MLNHVGKILELTNISQWHYIRTDKNPADIITRVIITSSELIVAEKWWQGPKWISTEEEKLINFK